MLKQDCITCRIKEIWKSPSLYTGSFSWSSSLLLLLLAWLLPGPSTAHPLSPDDSTLRVKALPFSSKLQNPCALADAGRLQRGALTDEERLATRRTAVRELRAKAALLNETAATVLRTNVLQDCSSLNLSLVAKVPTADDISTCEPIDILRMFYTSLLNHTAHVYFISDQLLRYAGDSCPNSEGLPASAKGLGLNLRELMCILRLCILTLKDTADESEDAYFSESLSQVLNEQLMDQPMCSRRSVRDCQTIYSTVMLLTEMTSYLKSNLLMDGEDPV